MGQASLIIEVDMKIEQRVINLIRGFKGRLPDDFVGEYVSLAEHNECAVALENLCTQLYEFDVSPEIREMDEIKNIGLLLGLDKATWEFLTSAPYHYQ